MIAFPAGLRCAWAVRKDRTVALRLLVVIEIQLGEELLALVKDPTSVGVSANLEERRPKNLSMNSPRTPTYGRSG